MKNLRVESQDSKAAAVFNLDINILNLKNKLKNWEKMEGLAYLSCSFVDLLSKLRTSFDDFVDLRSGQNTSYTIGELVLGGFSVFLFQNSSFLEQQRLLSKRNGQNNYESLLGLSSIPSDGSIRSNLDEISPSSVFSSYDYVYKSLQENNLYSRYRDNDLGYLISFDGTQTISSEKICCESCNTRKLKNGNIQYYHACVQPVLSHPSQKEVIPLEASFIESQTDCEKQDCELNAAKRWITTYHQDWKTRLGKPLTIIGDDLYAHEPFCNLLIDNGLNFVFVCKPDSHKHLYEEVELRRKNHLLFTHEVTVLVGKDTLHYQYQFTNGLEIRDSTSKKNPALSVNWVELTVTNQKNEQTYYNAFITNTIITKHNVVPIAAAGRNRWAIENKAFNPVKNLGYNATHNFGHGKKHLANTLFALNMLAFLFHNFLIITSNAYNLILQNLPKKSDLWKHIAVLTQYFVFDAWLNLFDKIADSLDLTLY